MTHNRAILALGALTAWTLISLIGLTWARGCPLADRDNLFYL